MTDAPGRGVRVRYYAAARRGGDVELELADAFRPELAVDEGCLVGPRTLVSTRTVLIERTADGLRGIPAPEIEVRDGALVFDPSQGGARIRQNRRARGAFNRIVAEANWFGMVNAYVHIADAAVRLDRLLEDIGAAPPPRVAVVVGAHAGSKLPGYCQGDGDRRSGAIRPLSGGHYRVSTRTKGVLEPYPVLGTGEIHLGPSQYRKPFAGYRAYLRNAAHNPAIIYHELAHHLCRHTADFRLNGERRPERQRNGKVAVEEGVCDYFAAALLGSGRPYGWYRADRGWRRDPEHRRHAADAGEDSDAHAAGAPWASAFWLARRELARDGAIATPLEHDRAIVAMLARVGEVAARGKRRTRARRAELRSSAATVAEAYLGAIRESTGTRGYDRASRIIAEYGLGEHAAAETESVAAC